jgi:hypothetical protein
MQVLANNLIYELRFQHLVINFKNENKKKIFYPNCSREGRCQFTEHRMTPTATIIASLVTDNL